MPVVISWNLKNKKAKQLTAFCTWQLAKKVCPENRNHLGKICFWFFNPHLKILMLILERKERTEREREKTIIWETCIIGSYKHSDLELNPQQRYVPWQGIEPETFWWIRWCSNQPSHMARVGKHTLFAWLEPRKKPLNLSKAKHYWIKSFVNIESCKWWAKFFFLISFFILTFDKCII